MYFSIPEFLSEELSLGVFLLVTVVLGGGAAWNHIAMEQAIGDAGLETHEVSNPRTGLIMGSGGPSTRSLMEAVDIARTKGPKRVGPCAVPKAMSSTASATLSTWFKIKGVNYSI